MHIYIADNAGVLTGPVDLPVIPGIGIQVPSNALQLEALLDEPTAGNVWALVNGQPQQLPDHRGKVYRKEDGAELQHAEVGELPDALTTEPRTSPAHRWLDGAWQFDAALAAAQREADELTVWEAIKAERDRRTQQGGYQASGHWFHSDTFSRSQQLGLVMMGQAIPAIQWKTMSGAFVTMTASLAQAIFAAGAASDQAIFAAAEQHYAAMQASANPLAYDYSAGWPAVYGE
ncbi:DUF4376 domain-containing protein [Pseudomonas anguilliseptica]|uniref:DUF4376 domain-containing protein n=1 Tax=Pseudomonas anguilliseptica TaxID=53406 RepID=A0A1H5A7G7_PSEAG|nr:DUF4376 domain-containing protein [Pseudomonas anguilliseptica]SED37701.1 protein of unknown function [Pseudomonas anguilliseptica]